MAKNHVEVAYISSLPFEVLEQIFRGLGPKDVGALRHVCTYWKSIVDKLQLPACSFQGGCAIRSFNFAFRKRKGWHTINPGCTLEHDDVCKGVLPVTFEEVKECMCEEAVRNQAASLLDANSIVTEMSWEQSVNSLIRWNGGFPLETYWSGLQVENYRYVKFIYGPGCAFFFVVCLDNNTFTVIHGLIKDIFLPMDVPMNFPALSFYSF